MILNTIPWGSMSEPSQIWVVPTRLGHWALVQRKELKIKHWVDIAAGVVKIHFAQKPRFGYDCWFRCCVRNVILRPPVVVVCRLSLLSSSIVRPVVVVLCPVLRPSVSRPVVVLLLCPSVPSVRRRHRSVCTCKSKAASEFSTTKNSK